VSETKAPQTLAEAMLDVSSNVQQQQQQPIHRQANLAAIPLDLTAELHQPPRATATATLGVLYIDLFGGRGREGGTCST